MSLRKVRVLDWQLALELNLQSEATGLPGRVSVCGLPNGSVLRSMQFIVVNSRSIRYAYA